MGLIEDYLTSILKYAGQGNAYAGAGTHPAAGNPGIMPTEPAPSVPLANPPPATIVNPDIYTPATNAPAPPRSFLSSLFSPEAYAENPPNPVRAKLLANVINRESNTPSPLSPFIQGLSSFILNKQVQGQNIRRQKGVKEFDKIMNIEDEADRDRQLIKWTEKYHPDKIANVFGALRGKSRSFNLNEALWNERAKYVAAGKPVPAGIDKALGMYVPPPGTVKETTASKVRNNQIVGLIADLKNSNATIPFINIAIRKKGGDPADYAKIVGAYKPSYAKEREKLIKKNVWEGADINPFSESPREKALKLLEEKKAKGLYR